MAQVRVDARLEDKRLRRFLSELSSNLANAKRSAKPLGRALSAIVYKDIIEHFQDEKGPDGKWKDWSDVYQRHMERIGKASNKILQDTGQLRQRFTPNNWRGLRGVGFQWFNHAQTKSGFPYAYAHDTGGPKLPKREFMWLSDEAFDKVATAALSFVSGDN